MANSDFDEFIRNEMEKQKGIYVPVQVSPLMRLLVTSVNCKKIHPNPDDEFCFPDVGPSYRIISEYEKKFRDEITKGNPPITEPLIVSKVSPDGYMLVNGHHRWAAALTLGFKRVPVKLINMTTDEDIRRMIESSKHDRRVTVDLDEVVFRDSGYPYLEKALGFPHNIKFKQRMRLGIPALFHYLNAHGYDIWVYSAYFYSIDDIRRYFKYYSVNVDGIITGTAKKKKDGSDARKDMDKLIANKYDTTVHLDNDLLLVTRGKTKEFDEIAIEDQGEKWSKNVMEAIDTIE
jgi:hypothetical protein